MKASREASLGLRVLANVCTTWARLPPRTEMASAASPALGDPQDRMFPGCLSPPFGAHTSCVCMHVCTHELVWICGRGTRVMSAWCVDLCDCDMLPLILSGLTLEKHWADRDRELNRNSSHLESPSGILGWDVRVGGGGLLPSLQ